ncbi:hypothetical protein MNBD_GAMMA16-790 [hydrothermal vent metagenome]|uniref:Uncharacterized protein n=1 Tax=hydrothermal vent metagenome TaxID=652676 RepID=A0A3B0ZHL9_9ZZZZ
MVIYIEKSKKSIGDTHEKFTKTTQENNLVHRF